VQLEAMSAPAVLGKNNEINTKTTSAQPRSCLHRMLDFWIYSLGDSLSVISTTAMNFATE
jgi:hypothetical protein